MPFFFFLVFCFSFCILKWRFRMMLDADWWRAWDEDRSGLRFLLFAIFQKCRGQWNGSEILNRKAYKRKKVSQWEKKSKRWVLIFSLREVYVSYKGISHEALVMALFHFDSLWSFAERVQNIFPNSWTKSCKDIDVKEAEQYCVAHFLLCYVLCSFTFSFFW